MTKSKVIILLICFFFIQAVFSNKTAQDLLQCFEKNGLSQVNGFLFRQTISSDGRDSREFLIECHLSDKAEKMIATFEEPPKMAGTKVLFKEYGKQLWTYFPETNRVRKIAVSSSTEQVGSLGFSYSDLFPYMNDSSHTSSIIGDTKVNGKSCTKVEVIHKVHDTSVITINKTHLYICGQEGIALKSEHFTANGRLLKTVMFNDYENVEGVTVPSQIVIKQIDIGEVNTLDILAIETGKEYSPAFFSELSLKR